MVDTSYDWTPKGGPISLTKSRSTSGDSNDRPNDGSPHYRLIKVTSEVVGASFRKPQKTPANPKMSGNLRVRIYHCQNDRSTMKFFMRKDTSSKSNKKDENGMPIYKVYLQCYGNNEHKCKFRINFSHICPDTSQLEPHHVKE